ncbi:1-aminocyclopropane-1-carboxylate deaminase/D-cysteine desulfhydrase [Priestia megaterium]|uniref:1-aminocyclopropane-1-carboxylate deaminase/D-cysteine desulfhydrase n=1 Tax=Priestia megaterium TaxID=1404 RepID=UPI00177C95C4|nr:pyridoxal-phosphate dependent enzyme [Priestia megaterium]MBD8110039.1 pyridoxal-phosphate dependent enzyme [Priestia megaterium]
MLNLTNYSATPIQLITENLNNNNFYMKRDDLFPLSFGGNKARKAVHFFKDMISNNADCIVTYGSNASNHCRVVANIAASMKVPCYIVSPNQSDSQTFNSEMVKLFNASIIKCPIEEVNTTIKKKLKELKLQGYIPYFIPGGGHGDIGTKAYLEVYREIVEFERTSGVQFDYIFHTTGTGTTQAGLVCGKILGNDEKKIVGISNARRNPYGGKVVLESINSYLGSIGAPEISKDEVVFIDAYTLEGYGKYNVGILNTIENILRQDGIPLDPIYTGKSFWGMKEYIKSNGIKDKNVLFIHTGGTPLFFNHLKEIK